jgi:hypothetical protein
MLPSRHSEPGPIIDYVQALQRAGRHDAARDIVHAVRDVGDTAAGRILLELLMKCTSGVPVPVLSDPRALAARNAQSFIAHDLRRLMSDEFDATAKMEQPPRTRG